MRRGSADHPERLPRRGGADRGADPAPAWAFAFAPDREAPDNARLLAELLCACGGALQAAILLPALRAVGFRFEPVLHVWTPAIRKMLKLTLPVAVGAGVLQLSVLLDKGLSLLLMQGTDAAGHAVTHFGFFGHWVRFPMESVRPPG